MEQNSSIKNVNKKTKSNTKWKITKYFILWGIFVFAGIQVKKIILNQLASNIIINPIFAFKEVHNTGAAFNLFQGRTDALVLAGIICIAALTGFVLFKPQKITQQMTSAAALLTAGMTINTAERIRQGFVTDFIYLNFFDKFPVFNIADIMIVIGALMLACALLFKSKNGR